MQYICLSICTLLDTDSSQIAKVPENVLEKAYRFTTANFEYSDVVKTLMSGPNTRGNKRKIYKTESGKELDIYGLIVEAVSIDPPLMGLDIDEMKYRMDKLIINEDKKPDKRKLEIH